MSDSREFCLKASAWPFVEARTILKRLGGTAPEKGYVLFETGYGPSGLPHIGTFGEVARTSMVRHAFGQMSDIPTRLIAFSDDMDGFRKVPDNLPEQDMLSQHLNLPLTQVPDPFGTHESLGHHNNARLRSFLDSFGFDYEFMSSSAEYKKGTFDQALLRILARYDEVMSIMLPTLGEDRRKTYSPFLPVCPKSGHVLQVPVVERHPDRGTIVFTYEDGSRGEVPVTGGNCKLQWKPDWAMRWHALGVDYEMSGKDLIDSVKQAGKICRVLGSNPPAGFSYELFLDNNGEKISKSRGNGLAVEEWLRYAPPESLSLFMFQKPKTAKRLFFDVIPKAVDEYFSLIDAFPKQDDARRIENPVWHIHGGTPPNETAGLGFNILLNLVSVCHAEDKSVLWHFIGRYRPGVTADNTPVLDDLVEYALNYYRDFVRPAKVYRLPDDSESAALSDLVRALAELGPDACAQDIQAAVYEIGKRDTFPDLKSWFRALYEILLGQSQGPRMGSFIALYGVRETIDLINRALAGEDLSNPTGPAMPESGKAG